MSLPFLRIAVGFAIFGVVIVGVLRSVTTAQPEDNSATAFVSDRGNDKEVLVQGWSEQEVARILADFSRQYNVPRGFDPRIQPSSVNVWRITFPEDYEPRLFYFLINYLNYPKNMDLTRHTIDVLGRTTLSSAFNLPAQSIIGKQAVLYVPEGDRDYDLVYIHLTSGESYKMSFTDMQWQHVETDRMPSVVRNLLKTSGNLRTPGSN